MNAIGMYIFGGSQTIGHLKAGWNVSQILEMTEDMCDINAYHFVKNYPNITILPPSSWNNNEYLNAIKCNNYDLLFANPPCSGLSSINRNASVDSAANVHLYETFDVIDKLEPKIFFIENAPTLVNLGLPILKQMSTKLNDKYRFTIINDIAGNHNVAMYRRRTFVIGWNRRYFTGMPKINQQVSKKFTVKDAFKGLSNDLPNMEYDTQVKNKSLFRFYNMVSSKNSIMKVLANNYDDIQYQLSDEEKREVLNFKTRLNSKSNVWDKSSYRLDEDDIAPSMSSIIQLMHPTENRDLYIREYARIMGYPDEFIFYPNECKCSTVQCLAQGVPVNFIYYISSELKSQLNSPTYCSQLCDIMYINQVSGIQQITYFDYEDFQNCNKISENSQMRNNFTLF